MPRLSRLDIQPENLRGQRFGRLLVQNLFSRAPTKWLCLCDCGKTHVVVPTLLKKGKCRSCGCLRKEVLAKRQFKHGQRHTQLYGVWCAMKNRCLNKNVKCYKLYGGRGITVCKRWMDFENFYQDMGNPPSPGMQIERRDNDGPYAPVNCYWATPLQQGSNKRNNVKLTALGSTKIQSEWARVLGVKDATIRKALRRGVAFEDFVRRYAEVG